MIENPSIGIGLYSPLTKIVKPFLRDVERAKVSDPSMRTKSDFVENFLGDFIKELSEGGKKHSSDIYSYLAMMVVDQGLARPQEFLYSGQAKKPTAEAIAMFNRQSALYKVKKRCGLTHKKDGTLKIERSFHTLSLDLEEFRKIDEAGAGDYNLNIVAKAIQDSKDKIIKLGIDTEDLITSRYGGDEFYIFIIGDKDKSKIDDIKTIIKDAISSSKGYFEKNSRPRNIRIKHDKIESIELPKDNEKKKAYRQKFLEFIDRKSVLDNSQLDKEVKYERENPLTNIEKGRRETKGVYPADIENIGDAEAKVTAKIEYLIKNNPRLKIPYWYALAKDSKALRINPKAEKQVNVIRLLDFCQEYLIDPLLNEIVLGRFDIQDRLQNHEFSRVFVYEVKVKEINDRLSWTYADERVIKKIWAEEFRDVFRKEIQDGILEVGRIGGSIVIMQKEGFALTPETENKLRKFKDNHFISKYDSKRGVINHEIGFAEIDTHGKNPAKVFKKIFTEPTKDWLRKTFARILNDKDEYERFIQLLGNDEDDIPHTLTFLSARYFTGNRWKNRAIVARKILLELNSNKSEISNQKITEILNKLDFIERIKSKKE